MRFETIFVDYKILKSSFIVQKMWTKIPPYKVNNDHCENVGPILVII